MILRLRILLLAPCIGGCSFLVPDLGLAELGLLAGFTPNLSNGITWTNQQLSLQKGALTGNDDGGVGGPSVLKVNGIYKMWYTVSDAGSVARIAYCESGDGINWSNHQIVVDSTTGGAQGTHDDYEAYAPSVSYDGTRYTMLYSGRQGSGGGPSKTIYADSTNGISWSNYQLALGIGTAPNNFDSTHAFNPTHLGDRLWYTGVNGSAYAIGLCTTTDGVHYSGCTSNLPAGTQGTLDTNKTTGNAVYKDKLLYKTWYSGATSGFTYDLIYCESSDGLLWSNCQPSILRGAQGTYDTNAISGPTVLVENGVGRMWYVGGDGGGQTRILYAESY